MVIFGTFKELLLDRLVCLDQSVFVIWIRRGSCFLRLHKIKVFYIGFVISEYY
jgi:hypothetical protein